MHAAAVNHFLTRSTCRPHAYREASATASITTSMLVMDRHGHGGAPAKHPAKGGSNGRACCLPPGLRQTSRSTARGTRPGGQIELGETEVRAAQKHGSSEPFPTSYLCCSSAC